MKKIFLALGNDRPKILIQLEDYVLQAIIAILEGKSREDIMGTLYSQILSLEMDLANDNEALNWFNLSATDFSIPPTPPLSNFPSTPLAAVPSHLKDNFQG
jgi:hypothetical protein